MNMLSYEGATIDNRYRLIRFLDEGCFGAVFRAEQMAYGVALREVAVKIAKQPMTDLEARDTFRDALIMTRVVDAIADAALRNHFITVHDAGRCPEDGPLPGHPYMAMELVPGSGLHQRLKPGPFPLKRALAYFDQMLTAMAFMHQGVRDPDGRTRPVVHRDLKPANILVVRQENGEDILKITDFGLALPVDSLLGWAESGGDMAYLAPESFSHNICSPQSDVYMLGLIFYEMITHRQPFAQVGRHLRGSTEKDSTEIRQLHLKARQREGFRELENHVELKRHPGLVRVMRTALAPDMGSRTYRNGVELKAAWEKAREEGRGPEHGTTTGEMPWETVRRLTELAEQCYRVGDLERGHEYLERALTINRDRDRVPDKLVNGRCYHLSVNRRLEENRKDEAGQLATEGYGAKVCRSTCLAVADYYGALGSAVAAGFLQKAGQCPDRE
jgi:serine/threonine protein kinase